MVVNSLIILIFGAIIGVSCAFWVVVINDRLEPPWSYICAIAIPFLTKPVVLWFATLAVVPFVQHLTTRIFRKFTGNTVPEHQRPTLNITGNTLTLPVAASIAVTIYLIGFNASSGNGINDGMIFYIATLVGAVVSLSENLSNPVVIKAIWHNRATTKKPHCTNDQEKIWVEARSQFYPIPTAFPIFRVPKNAGQNEVALRAKGKKSATSPHRALRLRGMGS